MFQKVDLLHRAHSRVPLYVSLADGQMVLDIRTHEEEAMALVGYARVSSIGQRLEVQVAKLQHCDKLFEEPTSGSTATRPHLVACLDYVREGDTLVVTRLDRLARSTWHLCQIAELLTRKRVHLQVLDQSIDTSDATGRLLFHMLGAIAQFETELRAERQREGIEKAQERGVHFGRQKKLSPMQIRELHRRRAQGSLIRTLMADYGLSKVSVYRYLRMPLTAGATLM